MGLRFVRDGTIWKAPLWLRMRWNGMADDSIILGPRLAN